MQLHCIKMRYSIEPRDGINVKGYGFLSFSKNIGKNLSNKYDQNLLIVLKNSQRMQQKLLQNEQFKKQQKQLVIQLVTKLQIK